MDGLVIRAESKPAAEALAADYHRGPNWAAKLLSPEGDAQVIFGAERSCWGLE